MGLESSAGGSESRVAAYVEAITLAFGLADRTAPFRSYCAGLLLPDDRKSAEPMATRVQPGVCRQRISRSVTAWPSPNGPTRRCSRRYVLMSCPSSSSAARSER